MKRKVIAMCLTAIMTTGAFAAQELRMPGMFSEGMVLQRDMPVPVWGAAHPGATVAVSLLGQKETATADEQGRWRVTLKPLAATAERQSLLVAATHETVIPIPNTKQTGKIKTEEFLLYTNVLVGEVWIVCGQSNALMAVASSDGFDAMKAEAPKYEFIRTAQISRRNAHTVKEPQDDVQSYWGPVKWEDSRYSALRNTTSDIPGGCSAISYYFARELSKAFSAKGEVIPIGMLEATNIIRVESWIAPEAAAADPVMKEFAGKGYPWATGRSYLANIGPLVPYAMRGAIYYQGEMNAGDLNYRHGLNALIRSWRAAWGSEFPFLVVQLPGFIEHKAGTDARLDMDASTLKAIAGNDEKHGFITVREAQRRAARENPNVGLAVTIDLGHPTDIHPPRKREVAERLALLARRLAYGEKDLAAEAPSPTETTFSGNTCRVRFANANGGLVVNGKDATGFELAGADGVFKPATAAVKDDTVTITATEVTAPTAVRYAWRGYPEWSLKNAAGLPATPFRYPEE